MMRLARYLPRPVKNIVKKALGRPQRLPGLAELSSSVFAPVPPLSPMQLESIIGAHNRLPSPARREAISRELMSWLITNPEYGFLINGDYCQKKFREEELYGHALAAISFGAGDLMKGRSILEAAVRARPGRWNYVCYGRCLLALGELEAAKHVFAAGLRGSPADFELSMELATVHYLGGATSVANELLESVKHHFFGPQFTLERQQGNRLTSEVAAASRNKTLHRVAKADVYDDSFVTKCWWDYWKCFSSYHRYQEGTAWLGMSIRDRISNLITADPAIGQVIDFGVLCGHPNHCLALKFPHIDFVGIDRQDLIKRLNDEAFQAPNLRFVAGDILEQLPRTATGKGSSVLFHARTACLCYPEFLRKLYKQCADLGIKYIIMYEGLSLSKHYLRFFDYEDFPQEAFGVRGIMFAHNYPSYLRDAGYEVISNDRVVSSLLLNSHSDLGATNVWIVARLRS